MLAAMSCAFLAGRRADRQGSGRPAFGSVKEGLLTRNPAFQPFIIAHSISRNLHNLAELKVNFAP
jgi:hypothetical protein